MPVQVRYVCTFPGCDYSIESPTEAAEHLKQNTGHWVNRKTIRVRTGPPRRKTWVTADDRKRILDVAREASLRDYLVLGFLASCGLRRSEVVGQDDPRPQYRKVSGLMVEDLDLDRAAFWVRGKGHETGRSEETELVIPSDLLGPLKEYVAGLGRDKGKLFQDLTTRQVYRMSLLYAKLAGVKGRIHPHRLRAHFITTVARKVGRDPFKVQNLARHKDIRTTSGYVAQLDLEEKREIVTEKPS